MPGRRWAWYPQWWCEDQPAPLPRLSQWHQWTSCHHRRWQSPAPRLPRQPQRPRRQSPTSAGHWRTAQPVRRVWAAATEEAGFRSGADPAGQTSLAAVAVGSHRHLAVIPARLVDQAGQRRPLVVRPANRAREPHWPPDERSMRPVAVEVERTARHPVCLPRGYCAERPARPHHRGAAAREAGSPASRPAAPRGGRAAVRFCSRSMPFVCDQGVSCARRERPRESRGLPGHAMTSPNRGSAPKKNLGTDSRWAGCTEVHEAHLHTLCAGLVWR